MSLDPWCKGCGGRIEWQPHRDGRMVAIDPDPVPDGPLAFGPGMKLGPATHVSKRRYRYHITGCPKPEAAMRKSAPTDDERRCYRCDEVGHFAADCPND